MKKLTDKNQYSTVTVYLCTMPAVPHGVAQTKQYTLMHIACTVPGEKG